MREEPTNGREEQTIGLGGGLAGVVLVIVIAWALAAVLMLTGTLTNARQINHRVVLVNRQVDPIDKNVAFVKLARRTGQIAARINLAARPLAGELTQVIGAAGRIGNKVGSILTTAHSINRVVHSINGVVTSINGNARLINGNAHSINGVVHGINGNVNGINASVQSIGASAASIGASVGSIHARVARVAGVVGPVGATNGSINANVTRIRGRLGGILSTAQGIRVGVIGINNRAQTVIDMAALLKRDFDQILAGVGIALNTGTVLGHANSIDCSKLINSAGPTRECNK